MSEKAIPQDISAMSFEDALAELEKIVKGLETGESRLDESIANYERGNALKLHCEKKLAEAQERVEKITRRSDGSLATEETRFD